MSSLETHVLDGDVESTVATVRLSAVASGQLTAGAMIEVAYPGPNTPIGQYLETGQDYVLVLMPYGDEGIWQFADPVQCVYPVSSDIVTSISPHGYLPPTDVLAALGLQ